MDDRNHTISHLSSYSTIVFALALFIAVLLDLAFPFKFLNEPWNQYVGVGLVLLGTLVVFSAETTGRKYSERRKRGEVTHVTHIATGMYSFTRNPKYLGLGILLVGLGVILNSLFVIAGALISIMIINTFLISREEELLANRHGDLYHEYKKKVRRWF